METGKTDGLNKLIERFGKRDNDDLPKIPSLFDWNQLGVPEKETMRQAYKDAGQNLDELIRVHSDGCKTLKHEIKWRDKPIK